MKGSRHENSHGFPGKISMYFQIAYYVFPQEPGVLMRLFGVWDLEWARLFGAWNFEVSNVLIWGTEFREDECNWGLIFLCFTKFVFSLTFWGGRKRTANYLGSLKTLVWLFGDLREILDMSTPVPKVVESSTGCTSALLTKAHSKDT